MSSNLELGRNEDAIVDATLALRELNSLLGGAGSEEDFWDIVEERKDEDTLVWSDLSLIFLLDDNSFQQRLFYN